mgnify:FL=1
MGEDRAMVEAMVAKLYGLTREEFGTIFEDFPLIDRGQPVINNEKKSTVTVDYCFGKFDELMRDEHEVFQHRIAEERKVMAHPFIPSEMISLCELGGLNR